MRWVQTFRPETCFYSPPFRHLGFQGTCGNDDKDGGSEGASNTAEEPLTLAEGYEYVGCFRDKHPMAERDMPLTTKREFPQNKPRMCANRCSKQEGAAFFGLQNGGL